MKLKKSLDAVYYSTALCDLQLMNRQFAEENITYNSLLYLDIIFSMKEKCTASRLAELLHVSKPAVTLKLNELIRQGLVIKVPDPDDHRQKLLTVNEDAMPKYKVYRRQDNEAIERIKDKFSEEEIQKFCEMLDIISTINFQEIDAR